MMKNKLEKAIELLRRWDDADIPDAHWSEPGEDFTLPLDTSAFLAEVDGHE